MGSLLPSLLHFCNCDLSGYEVIFPRLILFHSMFIIHQRLHLYTFLFFCILHAILLKHYLHKQRTVVNTRNAIKIPLATSFNDTHFWGLFCSIKYIVSLLPQSWFCIFDFNAKPFKSSWHISSHTVCMKTSPGFFVNSVTARSSRIFPLN